MSQTSAPFQAASPTPGFGARAAALARQLLPAASRASLRLRVASHRLSRRAQDRVTSVIERRREPAGPRAWIGAFGKHPCATDHLTDLPGDAPPSLGEVAAALYFGGVREEVAAGAWDELERDGNAIPFGHSFAHRPANRPGHLVVGRLWASRDGVRPRPRTDFPMVAVAELRGIDPPVGEVLDVLRAFEAVCRSTQDRAAVVAGLEAARERLARLEAYEAASMGGAPFTDVGRVALDSAGAERALSLLPPDGGWWAFVADGRAWADVVKSPAEPADFRFLRDGRPPASAGGRDAR